MGKKEKELELLLEQRKTLISDIKELNSNMFKVIIAIIPLIITVFISYYNEINDTSATIIRFGVLEIILILSMVICACLFAANNNRDYISAIDKYVFEKYDISVLFHSGELSKEHTTGTKGIFPRTTTLIGVSSFIIIFLFLVYIIFQDICFYLKHFYLLIILVIQIYLYLKIIYDNHKRKSTKKSTITEECLEYIKRSEELKQQEKTSTSEKNKPCP